MLFMKACSLTLKIRNLYILSGSNWSLLPIQFYILPTRITVACQYQNQLMEVLPVRFHNYLAHFAPACIAHLNVAGAFIFVLQCQEDVASQSMDGLKVINKDSNLKALILLGKSWFFIKLFHYLFLSFSGKLLRLEENFIVKNSKSCQENNKSC